MKINEDFKKASDIISDTVDLCIKETLEKNPTFLIPNKDVGLNDKVYIIPIEDNKPLKVIFK